MTLALAGTWTPKVRANVVLPSANETDMNRAWPSETKMRVAEANPMKRLGRPEDLVGVCVFLASDAASYVNGAQVPVDGGMYRSL
jgi:NAD(P)-dependent dehydrogenase (short-subunit alcohol dehydrogenase family)